MAGGQQSFADTVTSVVTKTNPFVALRDALRSNSSTKVDNPVAKPSPPKIIQGGSYKSLADLQATGYAKDKKSAEFAAARNLKDVKQAANPRLKMQAVTGKLDRVTNSKDFQSLSIEHKTYVLSHYYDKYVAPTLKENGIEPPEKADWIKGYGRTLGTEDTGPVSSRVGTFTSAVVSGQADMARLTANLFKHAAKLGPTNAKVEDSPVYKKVIAFADKMQKVSTDYDSAFESRHDAAGWLSNFGGHIIGDAPAYMAAGIGAEAIVPSLAEKATISKGFKVGYSALKTAGEVFSVEKGEGRSTSEAAIDAGAAALLGSPIHALALKFKGAQLAVGGEPFANKIAQDTNHVQALEMHPADYEQVKNNAEFLTKGPKALANVHDPDYKQAVNNEQHLREHFAKEFHPEKAEASGGKSVWRNLSSGQRIKIQEHIHQLTQQAAKLMPVVNPEVQTQANNVEITREALANPAYAQGVAEVEKLTGLKVAEVLTKIQAKQVLEETGLGSPAHVLEETFGGGGLFGENISRTKGLATVSTKGLTNPLTPEDIFLEGTQKYFEKNAATKSGVDYFENPEHHLLWLANHSDAPATVKQAAFMRLRRDYNISHDQAITKGNWLAEHRADLLDTGILQKEGVIFRSTRTTPRRFKTQWQAQLYEQDLPAADLATLKKLISKKPELKAPIESLLENLNAIRNSAATPLTSRLRRNAQKGIQDILREYK